MPTKCLRDSNTVYHHALVQAQMKRIKFLGLHYSYPFGNEIHSSYTFTSRALTSLPLPFTMEGSLVARDQAFGLQEQTQTPSFLPLPEC
jgi:hypothetical protein